MDELIPEPVSSLAVVVFRIIKNIKEIQKIMENTH
jgi:hypothetical protein